MLRSSVSASSSRIAAIRIGAARGFVAAARLHADEAVLHQIDAPHAVLAADRVQRFEQLHRRQLLAVHRNRNALLEADGHFLRLDRALLSGSCVSIQISSGAALAGSSSAPPSCEMCQMLRSRL